MATICLITAGQPSTNPRMVKEADALADAGHTVRVICTRLVDWALDTDRGLQGRDWQVVASIPVGPQANVVDRVWQGVRRRVALAAYRGGLRGLGVVEAAWHAATPELVRAAGAVRADLYIAHYPAALPAAARAAARYGARYTYDAEDFHLGDSPEGAAFDAVRSMTRRIEAAWLPGAAVVTAASPGIAVAYEEAYGITRPTVVLNAFPRHMAPPAPTTRGGALPSPSVYWFSQTIGPGRGLECAVEALARAECQPYLYVRGRMAAGYGDRLDALARAHGVRDRLHLLPLGAPDEMARLAAAYDVGLSGETADTRNHEVALGNKVFTYLLAGLPVVASAISAHEDLAPALGAAMRLYRTDDAADLAAALDAVLLGQRPSLAERRRHAWQLAQDRYCWDVERRTVVDAVAHVLAAGR